MKQITVAVCFALMPFVADAAGLGKLTVISSLGQPLDAEIELLSATNEELASMSARIAPSSTYADQGIERASILSAVRVELSKRPDGIPILKLTSPQSINDPFLDMLIEVDWSSGRLQREYTALLDPPGFGDQPAAVAVAAPIAQEQNVSAIDKPISKPMAEKKGKPRKAAAMPKAPSDAERAQEALAGEGHITQRGDTLGGIASQMPQVEGVSLDQMLVGVYRANPEAFIGGNMNRLKVGQIVRQPSAEELQAISPQEAVKEIRVQTADWNAYRNKLASAVAESEPAKEELPRQAASGKISAAAEDKGAASSVGPRDVVKLSKGDVAPEKAGAAAKGGKPEAHDKTDALQEEVTAREKSIKEANDRVALLEKQVQELKQLLEMKSQAMADLQKGAVALKTEPAKPATPEPAKVEPAAPVMPEAKSEIKPPEIKQEAAKVDADQAKHKPKRIVQPPVVEPDLMDTLFGALMANLPLLGGGLAALGAVGWLAARRKSKKKERGVEQVMPATSSALAAGSAAAAGDTSFLTDFSQPNGGGMIDTNEVDPISEAEVYMAYGRDAQAEEILKDAIKKDPKRYELHVKLLEIYANRKDNTAFEPLANELFSTPGTDDPIWAKVAELGRKVDPGNPRYAAQAAVSATAEDMEATQIFEATEPAPAVAASDSTLDFSLDAGTDAAATETEVAVPSDSNSLDFDMGALGGTDEMVALEIPAAEAEVPVTEVSDSHSINFDMGTLGGTEELGGVDEPGGMDEMVALEIPEAEPEAPAIEAVADLNVFDSAAIEALPEVAAELPALTVEPVAETAGFDLALELPEPAAAENVQLDATDLGMEALPEIGLPEIEQSVETPMTEPAAEAEPIRFDEPGTGIEELPELEEPMTDNVTDDSVLELPELASNEAAEEIGLEGPSAAPDESSNDLDLVLPEFDMPVAEESTEQAEPVAEEMVFELPNAEEYTVEETPETPAKSVIEEMSLEASVEFPEAAELAAEPAAMVETAMDETIVLEKGEAEAGEADTEPLGEPQMNTKPVPEVDLSGIDLDLGGAGEATSEPVLEPGLESPEDEEIVLSGSSESADVDTKLDLVTAYLDMGDKEGARELLQEVLDEGGPQQRERAQKMMDALD